MEQEFATRFDIKQEQEIYQLWESNNIFTADPDSNKTPFVIVIPPPNITGSLHIGHALNNTLQDILIRFKRMQGYEALYLPGTDHAGIATQYVVEKELLKTENKTRFQLGKEEFLKRVWEWKQKYGNTILLQLKKLGCSCDWTRTVFTMDERYSRAVLTAFCKLYEKGYIYKGKRVINWCPRCHTSLSDLEIIHKDTPSKLWYIKYPLIEERDFITVATTRPETMLGDTAIAVNPYDTRYQKLVSKYAILPFINRRLPIIADPQVSPNFGTGALKITPAHDAIDYEISLRHNLPAIFVIDESGIMNKNAGIFEGLERFECRKKILEKLKEQNLLEKEEDYQVPLMFCYRCQQVLEPYLSEQWFVKMEELAKPAIRAVEEGHIQFIPDRFKKIYLDWMYNIKDWCISRQLWWGHQIPVWYCQCQHTFASIQKPDHCPKCKSENLKQDENVLDTWFSSALWAFATMGWPEKTKDMKAFYPTSILVTARDIINLWVARMIFTGYEFVGEKPFSYVFINPTIMNPEGKRMSKSLGTGQDPLELIEQYGADALRFGLAIQVTGLQDIRFLPEKVVSARNFATKLYNASRLVYQITSDSVQTDIEYEKTSLEDKWILSRINSFARVFSQNLEEYNFGYCCQMIYDFVWHEFCDWYLELAKFRKEQQNVKNILLYCLRKILVMLHPFMPFVTECIWQKFKSRWMAEPVLARAGWVSVESDYIDAESEDKMGLLIRIVRAIREVRNKFNIKGRENLRVIISATNEEIMQTISLLKEKIESIGSVSIEGIGIKISAPKFSASAIDESFTAYVLLEGKLEIEKELLRQERKKKSLIDVITKLEKRLGEPKYIEKAPREFHHKLNALKQELRQVEDILAELKNLR